MIESLENEVWKPIVGYEGLYEISSHGRIKSLEKRQIMPRNGATKIMPERILKNWMSVRYPAITLQKGGKEYKQTIHRLVAMHFIDNPEGYTHVRHMDDNPMNNYYKNLAWGTQKMNMHDMIRACRHRYGERGAHAKLKEYQVLEIRAKYNKNTCNHRQLSEMYSVSRSVISEIIARKGWKHI